MDLYQKGGNLDFESLPMVTRHVLWNTDAPGGNKVKLWQKSLSPTFWPHPKGLVMSVKCEQPLDELTVQVWLLYDHPNIKYCTFFYKQDGITDRQTDGWTIQTLDAPADLSGQAGGIKIKDKHYIKMMNKRPKGPHIVHLSTMCHLFDGLARAASYFSNQP